MGDPITQDNRLLTLTTDAGKDVLLIDTLRGVEGISQPYRYVLTMMSEVEAGNPAKVQQHKLVGTMMSVAIDLTSTGLGQDIGTRYLTGYCERFVLSGRNDLFAFYTATIVPWLSFLNYASNCRLFVSKTAPDIIQEVVSAHGYSDKFQNQLTKTYATRDYCVQYRETDFAFISRLMESEGIFYYFKQENGKHTMILADSTQYQNMPTQSSFKYAPAAGQDVAADSIKVWHVEEQMHTGKWTTRDYHHEAPTNHFETTLPSTTVATPAQAFETYDYPGDGAKIFNAVGSAGKVSPQEDVIVRSRIESEETIEKLAHGVSNCRSFESGYVMEVTGGADAGNYLLTYISHQIAQQPAYRNLDTKRNPYENKFTAIPSSILFVPQRVTARPVVHGLQTAFVVSDTAGEEIWPDKYGRVKVRFHWDRDAQYQCWVRVVQPWAGKSWGQQWLPRVGDEVAVTFLEGDPDCPVIIGGLYNSDNMPIFSLPDNKTQSGIQTRSSKGGGSSDYNMLRFEDKSGSEEIFIQAQKDWNSTIKHDETRTIKNDRTSTIHVNDSRTVEIGDDTISVQQGKRTITVAQDISETSQRGNITVTASAGSVSISGPQGVNVTGDSGVTISGPAGVTISSDSTVTISCGASSISMTPASISISAPMVMINS